MTWFDRSRLGQWLANRRAASWGKTPDSFRCGTCCDSGLVQVPGPSGTSLQACPAPNCSASRAPNNNDIVRVNLDWSRAAQQWKNPDEPKT